MTVNPGAPVLVGFENGDPKASYAIVYSGAAVESITFLGGTQGVARQGDAVSVYFLPVVPFSGTIAGLPAAGILTIDPSPAPGVILTGNPKVRA